jgi:hypothetical protein
LNARPGDVGIQHADGMPLASQRYGKQTTDERLAHASLSAHHGDYMSDVVEVCHLTAILPPWADALFLFRRHLDQVYLYLLYAV